MVRWKPSIVNSTPPRSKIPAQLTSTSNRSDRSSAASTEACSVTSSSSGSTRSWAVNAPISSSEIPPASTRYPACASARPTASPMPRVPPVTSATLPVP